jgi:phosphoribosylformylglycinamidine (FGAM) synthase PurS component
MYRVEVWVKEGFADPRSEGLEKDILDLGIKTVKRARYITVYLLEGTLKDKELAKIASELLTDPIVEEYSTQETKAP